ncbi:hypothetical protein K1719_028230 [Acacia pycnantha]|nr:hypothetical protein K1719_028230 [Acacia pycnantha]
MVPLLPFFPFSVLCRFVWVKGRQYLVFGELLETSSKNFQSFSPVLLGSSVKPLLVIQHITCKKEEEDSIDSKMQRAEPLRRPEFLTFLLVALNRETRIRIMKQLPPPQYQILRSPTVDSAVYLLEEADLVISNVSSKDDDEGYNFIAEVQHLRKNFPHVVIFEAEGLGDPEIIRAKQLGACYILWKPVSEQSDEIKNLRQHVFRGRGRVQNEDSSEGSSSSVSSQQKSLKRKNDEQPSEKERESSKKQRNLLETPTTDSPPQAHVVCQQQIQQHEHHEQHLPCQPMHNSGVMSLIGNGVNNLPSMPQLDGITFDILQQPGTQPTTFTIWFLLVLPHQHSHFPPLSSLFLGNLHDLKMSAPVDHTEQHVEAIPQSTATPNWTNNISDVRKMF